jgi:hypothetical protein
VGGGTPALERCNKGAHPLPNRKPLAKESSSIFICFHPVFDWTMLNIYFTNGKVDHTITIYLKGAVYEPY